MADTFSHKKSPARERRDEIISKVRDQLAERKDERDPHPESPTAAVDWGRELSARGDRDDAYRASRDYEWRMGNLPPTEESREDTGTTPDRHVEVTLPDTISKLAEQGDSFRPRKSRLMEISPVEWAESLSVLPEDKRQQAMADIEALQALGEKIQAYWPEEEED